MFAVRLLGVLVLVALNGFFAAAEFSLVAVRLSRVRQLVQKGNPRARIVYVTSQAVHPIILEYYLQFLAGIPASHARSRLTLLCADDASPRSLTEKILERPRLLERIRAGIVDPSRAYLTVFNSTPLERKLAVLLGVPLNGVDPRLVHLGTKRLLDQEPHEALGRVIRPGCLPAQPDTQVEPTR